MDPLFFKPNKKIGRSTIRS
uniref:Uncharacterized protein n=1 Tax=Lepeophtheirus salmonis TaxID=72036 RepID=A0A0K2VEC6_LEPSM